MPCITDGITNSGRKRGQEVDPACSVKTKPAKYNRLPCLLI